MLDFVVIGMGYVGLPLARAAVSAGLKGAGLDLSEQVVSTLNSGGSHIDDVSPADVAEMLTRGFAATTDVSILGSAKTIVICVPTPLSDEGGPDLGAVIGAAAAISEHLKPESLVILESTTWPGTTEEVVQPILERSGLVAGSDFHLSFSPERIDPGNAIYGVENTPKVVGGITSESTDAAARFYEAFITSVITARGTREAEMAKLLENTYRQVNIALVNEMARFSHEWGIDLWDVIRCASTKPFGFQAFYPGPGVGGHCIPIDPSYLSHKVQAQLGYPFRFVELAQEINRSMPRYVVTRAQAMLNDRSKALRGAKVLVLGVTYKAGIADQRESPAQPVAAELLAMGAELSFHDPFVEAWELDEGTLKRVPDLGAALSDVDLVVHLQSHREYSSEILGRAGVPILDTRGALEGDLIQRL